MSSGSDEDARAGAILLAAGRSTRMGTGGGPRKPFLELEGRTVLERSAEAFQRCPLVERIAIVGQEEDLQRIRALVGAMDKVCAVVAGGAERTDSVRLGFAALPGGAPLVAIHDAARPLVRPETIERCLRAAAESGAALVAVPASDTVKQSADGRAAERTLDRSTLWLAQTPQAFRAAEYAELLRRAEADGFRPTDDAALYERYRGPVRLVPGERANLKITTPEDLTLAAALLRERGVEEAAR